MFARTNQVPPPWQQMIGLAVGCFLLVLIHILVIFFVLQEQEEEEDADDFRTPPLEDERKGRRAFWTGIVFLTVSVLAFAASFFDQMVFYSGALKVVAILAFAAYALNGLVMLPIMVKWTNMAARGPSQQ